LCWDFNLSHRTYLNLISGQTPGYIGIPVRLMLILLSWPYRGIVRLRNDLYSSGLSEAHQVSAVVISVGNLTTGGTGKTPLVIWLCRLLQERQLRCAILTRGYKTPRGQLSDEPAVLTAQCPGIPIIINPNRVEGAAEAICRHDAQVLVMDDGFQHRHLARDLDIVAIDATSPFGYGRVLPAGLLREPITGLERAHAVVLTRCDQASGAMLQQIEEAIRRVNADLTVARSLHAPAGIKTADGVEIGIEEVRGSRIFAFCGVGNPQSFFRTVDRLKGVLAGSQVFDDHYRYTDGDLNQIYRQAVERQAALILTTQKDWTKIAKLPIPQGHPPLAYLAVELQITAGAQELTALIDRTLGDRMAKL
jgi:tetraacyldisaccharide 4'-kinase